MSYDLFLSTLAFSARYDSVVVPIHKSERGIIALAHSLVEAFPELRLVGAAPRAPHDELAVEIVSLNGVSLRLTIHDVAISAAYRFGRAPVAALYKYAAFLQSKGAFDVFDPQLGALVDPSNSCTIREAEKLFDSTFARLRGKLPISHMDRTYAM